VFVVLRIAALNLRQAIVQPLVRVYAVFLAGSKKGEKDSGRMGCLVGAGEEDVFTAQGERTDGSFHGVVVYRKFAVVDIMGELFKAGVHITDGFL
jgi:hypothetical protein